MEKWIEMIGNEERRFGGRISLDTKGKRKKKIIRGNDERKRESREEKKYYIL